MAAAAVEETQTQVLPEVQAGAQRKRAQVVLLRQGKATRAATVLTKCQAAVAVRAQLVQTGSHLLQPVPVVLVHLTPYQAHQFSMRAVVVVGH